MELRSVRQDGGENARIIRDGTALLPGTCEDISAQGYKEIVILDSMRMLKEHSMCNYFFIHGPSGSGKTAMAKRLVQMMEAEGLNCVYVNCWFHSTSIAIYSKIAESLGEAVSRRGRAADEIFDRVFLLMKNSRKPTVLILDEIDGLISNGGVRVLHNLTRICDDGARIRLIGIAEKRKVLSGLSPKIIDSLGFVSVKLRSCTREHLLELIKRKASKALEDGSYDLSILETIADTVASNSASARVAVDLLRRAAINAEMRGRNSIETADVEESISFIRTGGGGLSEEEMFLLDILKDGEKTTTEIY